MTGCVITAEVFRLMLCRQLTVRLIRFKECLTSTVLWEVPPGLELNFGFGCLVRWPTRGLWADVGAECLLGTFWRVVQPLSRVVHLPVDAPVPWCAESVDGGLLTAEDVVRSTRLLVCTIAS